MTFTVSFITTEMPQSGFNMFNLKSKNISLHFPGHSAFKMQVEYARGLLCYHRGIRGEKRRERKREEGREDIASVQYRCAP